MNIESISNYNLFLNCKLDCAFINSYGDFFNNSGDACLLESKPLMQFIIDS